MKNLVMVLILFILATPACSQNASEKTDLSTQQKKVSYAIGNNIGKNFLSQDMDLTMDEFIAGLKDGMTGTSQMTEEEIGAVLNAFQQEMMAKQQTKSKEDADKNKKEGEEFLTANKTKEGVITTASGLQYKVIKKGNGPKPTQEDKVTVHYKGTFLNGEEFDSSYKRNQPATFPVLGVIPGWIEALQLMNVGDKLELFIPYTLAYGENGKPPKIGPAQALLFEVELLEIVK